MFAGLLGLTGIRARTLPQKLFSRACMWGMFFVFASVIVRPLIVKIVGIPDFEILTQPAVNLIEWIIVISCIPYLWELSGEKLPGVLKAIPSFGNVKIESK